MCVTDGRLSEELIELLPDYQLAFTAEDGPAGAMSVCWVKQIAPRAWD